MPPARARIHAIAGCLDHRLTTTSRGLVQGSEEAEEAIEKGKEEKQKMREQVEAKVDDAHIGASSAPAPPTGKSAK
jgi:hypothetical protein